MDRQGLQTTAQAIKSAEEHRQATTSPIHSDTQREALRIAIRVRLGQHYYNEVVSLHGEPVSSDELKKALGTAADYILRIYENKHTKHNWLHIQGSIGTGKSTLARAITSTYFELASNVSSTMLTRQRSAQDLCRYLRDEKLHEWYEESVRFENLLFVDDIGTEPTEVMCYGSVYQPLTDLFYERYNRNLPLIYTTNLNGQKIGEKYGERVLDRMRERVAIITLTGTSYRAK